MSAPTAREAFTALAGREEREIGLLEGALLIAQEEYPDLPLPGHVRRVDEIADRLRPHVGPSSGFHNAVYSVNRMLFEELGFRGNATDYNDPDNSMMNRVLERKTGIPITLAILYIEVGLRLGLPVFGVSFPGHFLVGYGDPSGTSYVDPFHSGRILIREDLARLLSGLAGDDAELRPEFLGPATKRVILTRVLHNLKSLYYRNGDFRRSLLAAEQSVLLNPDAPAEVRDRGLLRRLMGDTDTARSDLTTYLSLAPDAPDAEKIRGLLREDERGPAE